MGQCAYKGCRESGTRRTPAPGVGAQTVDVCLKHQIVMEEMMAKICLVTGCENNGTSRGLCPKHYQRLAGRKLLPPAEAGPLTKALADHLSARWEEMREQAEAAKAQPKAVTVQPKAVTVQAMESAPVQPPAQHARKAPPERAQAVTVSPNEQRLKDEVSTLTKARDTLAAEVKSNAERICALTARCEVAEAERDEAAEANRDLTAEVERLTELDQRMDLVREAISALDLPAMDSYADAVRHLVRQRDEALAAGPAKHPAQPIAAPVDVTLTRLAALLRDSLTLRLAFVDAMQDRAHRTLRKAAEDPTFADSMAADLLSPEAG